MLHEDFDSLFKNILIIKISQVNIGKGQTYLYLVSSGEYLALALNIT